jgi:hypothetical protein
MGIKEKETPPTVAVKRQQSITDLPPHREEEGK